MDMAANTTFHIRFFLDMSEVGFIQVERCCPHTQLHMRQIDIAINNLLEHKDGNVPVSNALNPLQLPFQI